MSEEEAGSTHGVDCVALVSFDRECDRLSYRFSIDGSPFSISI